MKILQVGPNSVHVTSYLSALKTDGMNLYLLSEEPCPMKEIDQNFVVSFRSKNPLTIRSRFLKVRKIINALKPDVIHIHQINRLAFFVSRIASQMQIRLISTAWGSDVLLVPKKNALFHFLVKQTLKRSDVVTADSNDMIDAMNTIFPSEKYCLLQYGIDPIKSGIKEPIIYSNRLHEPLYRIDKVIDYFAAFSTSHPNWQLIIAGTGSQTELLKKKVQSLHLDSKITFVGWQKRDENRNWYARASIYISIPSSDGTSVSVLEAMSADCVPVVSDLPVSHEWIVSGKNGIIENQSFNPLYEAVQLNRELCAKKNQALIHEKATRAASIREFQKLYFLQDF